MVIKIFAGIGLVCVLYIIYMLLECSWEKFKRWRKSGCKIKMFCKPHKYEPKWLLSESGELYLKCQKCGKTKKLYIDTEAFREWFD